MSEEEATPVPDTGTPGTTSEDDVAKDAAATEGGTGGEGTGGEGTGGARRGFFTGTPRGLLALGVVAIAFVVAATVIAFGYGHTGPSATKPLTQSQIKRLLRGQGTSLPSLGFHKLDRAAPNFTLPPVIGSTPVELSKLTGRPIVVNFWYSTCPPCQAEAGALAAVSEATKGQVTFVGVDYEDSRSSAARFIRDHHESYPDGFDSSGQVATQLYDITGTPTTYFLSPNGRRVLGMQVGQVSAAELTSELHRVYGIHA